MAVRAWHSFPWHPWPSAAAFAKPMPERPASIQAEGHGCVLSSHSAPTEVPQVVKSGQGTECRRLKPFSCKPPVVDGLPREPLLIDAGSFVASRKLTLDRGVSLVVIFLSGRRLCCRRACVFTVFSLRQRRILAFPCAGAGCWRRNPT